MYHKDEGAEARRRGGAEAAIEAGQIVTVTPSELVAGGDALARVDGLPVFISGLYPGDVARVRVIEAKKGFARGEVVELLTPSPDRRAQPCPIAGECGGCDWTSLRLDRQLEAKRRILVESLRRIGKIDPASLPPIAMHPSPLNYRIRSRLQRDGDAIGFYALRSHRVVPLVPECEVVGVETAKHVGNGRDVRSPLVWELGGRLIDDEREIEIAVDRYTYRLSTRSFFQVNRHLLPTLLRLVTGHASRVRSRTLAVDLFAGVGFFSLPLAELFDRVIAVEGEEESARYARENAPPNAEVIAAPVEAWVARWSADFVFLDPPRAGTSKSVIETVAARAREMVCYLSCDPVTFARDASRLIASGWSLSTLDLIDLFPNTHHVETLSSFERAGGPS